MSLYARPQMNAARRRGRKAQLAARDGWRCRYCRCRFKDLREATMDHIVPVSLWRSSSAHALVLACLDCNRRKADRFPLSLALLLVWSVGPVFTEVQPTTTPAVPMFTDDASTFTGDAPVFTGPVRSADREPVLLGPDRVDWLMLARLAQARSRDGHLGAELRENTRLDARRVRIGRTGHHDHRTRMNAGEHPTDRGASA